MHSDVMLLGCQGYSLFERVSDELEMPVGLAGFKVMTC